MSAPARAVRYAPRPARRPAPRRRPAPHRGRAAFLALSGLLVGAMVLGLVVLNVRVTQSSFRLDELSDRAERLTRSVEMRRLSVARLSSPARIAREARRLGLRLPPPSSVVYLHAGEHSFRSGPRGTEAP
ncbi:MAG: hypothetical protein HY658_02215 [Actinobacteria bacterium]|nr:hypothetical protein [Actinomycetota bacterium]